MDLTTSELRVLRQWQRAYRQRCVLRLVLAALCLLFGALSLWILSLAANSLGEEGIPLWHALTGRLPKDMNLENVVVVVVASGQISFSYLGFLICFVFAGKLQVEFLVDGPRHRVMDKMVRRLQALGEIHPSAMSRPA